MSTAAIKMEMLAVPVIRIAEKFETVEADGLH